VKSSTTPVPKSGLKPVPSFSQESIDAMSPGKRAKYLKKLANSGSPMKTLNSPSIPVTPKKDTPVPVRETRSITKTATPAAEPVTPSKTGKRTMDRKIATPITRSLRPRKKKSGSSVWHPVNIDKESEDDSDFSNDESESGSESVVEVKPESEKKEVGKLGLLAGDECEFPCVNCCKSMISGKFDDSVPCSFQLVSSENSRAHACFQCARCHTTCISPPSYAVPAVQNLWKSYKLSVTPDPDKKADGKMIVSKEVS
jgi:hypothetical protein